MSLGIGALIAAFTAMLCWAVGDFLIQKSTRKIGDLESLTFIAIIGTLALFPLVVSETGLLFSYQNLMLLLILGFFTFIAAMFDFEALRLSKLSTADIIMELELPITISLGYFFFNEGLTTLQLVITSLVFAGIILTATESLAHWRIRWEKGAFMALLAAGGMGLLNFLTTVSSRRISPLMAVWAPWFILSIFCVLLIYKRGDFPRFVRHARRYKGLVLSMGVIDTVAWIAYSLAVFGENIGIITAITESYPAVAMFLGIAFNKEKINWHQYVGAAVAIISSIALGLWVS